MKKALSFILVLTLVFGSTSVIFADSAQTASSPAFTFSGEEIKLSLDEAIERMTTTGPAFESVMLTKDGNDAAARGQFEAIKAIEEARDQYKALTPEQQEMALYERAVDTFGASAQILQAVEEMSELTKALLKYIRFRNFGQGVREDLLADISEERADVSIMLNQLEVIFGDNSADECLKLQHLQQLLEAYQEGGANADHHH